jgi:hypothetical protein
VKTNGKKKMGNIYLLTGAGFSNDFGGYLREEMWERIFNYEAVKKLPKLANITGNDFDYESIYYKIHSNPQDTDEIKAIDEAILQAYVSIDNNIKNAGRGRYGELIYHVNKMIERFSSSRRFGGGGFFFTLNQDCYVERWFSSSDTLLHHPYFNKANTAWQMRDKNFDDTYCAVAPKEPLKQEESLNVGNFHYIKLHGSFNWKRSDGSNLMAIGQDKEKRIAEEPLLSCYSDIFIRELNNEDVKLLVIGYGFLDDYINQIIANSMINFGLKLVIVAPWKSDEFTRVKNVLSNNSPDKIIQNLYCYQKKLSELFTDDTWMKTSNILFS